MTARASRLPGLQQPPARAAFLIASRRMPETGVTYVVDIDLSGLRREDINIKIGGGPHPTFPGMHGDFIRPQAAHPPGVIF
jgi:hypothetical protein